MKYSYNIFILIIIFVVIILFNSFIKTGVRIGFQNNKSNWSPELISRFNIYQTTMNNNTNQFNLDILQRQASPEEVEEYLKTGFWTWPDDLQQLYMEYIWSNPIIKIQPQYALNYAMKLYNQTAARELLAWNAKEGKFLLYGGDLGVSDGMPKNVHNSIRCSNEMNNPQMEKTVYTGMNLWNGQMNSTTTIVNPEDIPKEMPGFSFVKDSCNPCMAFDSPPNYSCPFRLNVNGDNEISEPWKKIWNMF